MKNASTFLLILVFIFLISHIVSANTHTIYVDIKGNDNEKGSFTEPVETVSKAVEIAKSFVPTAENPALIQIGIGEFNCPEIWIINNSHIYYAGRGAELTKLISYQISIAPEIRTGFKDICLLATLDIGDNYLPISNSKILNLEKNSGEIIGTWFDFSGKEHSSKNYQKSTLSNQFSFSDEYFSEILNIKSQLKNLQSGISNNYGGFPAMAAPDEDATNTFVLKAGDIVNGPLIMNNVPIITRFDTTTPPYSLPIQITEYKNTAVRFDEAVNWHNAMNHYVTGSTQFLEYWGIEPSDSGTNSILGMQIDISGGRKTENGNSFYAIGLPIVAIEHPDAKGLLGRPYTDFTYYKDGIGWYRKSVCKIGWIDGVTGMSMMNNRVLNIGTPVVSNDAANKLYVDLQVGTRINSVTAGAGLSGGGTIGDITISVRVTNGITVSAKNNIIADATLLRTNTAAATYLTKTAATAIYLAITNAETEYLTINTASNTFFLKENLPIISGVYQFAGPINLNSNILSNISWPSNDFDAVSKAYVLSVLTNGETVVYISTNQLTIVSNNFYFSGDLILKDGQIWGLSPPMSNDNAATKLYVDNCFKGFDYDAKYVYIDKYYDGINGYNGELKSPYTNFFQALDVLGENAFFGGNMKPIIYHVGNGAYKFPANEPDGFNRSFRVGIVGRGAYFRNIHNHLSGYGSSTFSERGTYIEEIKSKRIDANNSANAVLYLKDMVISNVYLFSTAHDEIYCDNVVFLNENQNGQQQYHGQYYVGKMNWNGSYQSLDNDSLRPSYFSSLELGTEKIADNAVTSEKILNNTIKVEDFDTSSVDERYINKTGDTMNGKLTMNQATPISFWSDRSKIWAGDNKLKIKGMDGISFYDNINSYSSRELLDIKSSTVTLKGQRLTGLSTYNPTSDSDAATKKYVDNQVIEATTGGVSRAVADALYINADGDSMSGSLTFQNAYGNGVIFERNDNRHAISTDGGNFNFLTSQADPNGNNGYWWRMKNPAENGGNYYHVLWLTRRQEYVDYPNKTAMRLFHPLLMSGQPIKNLPDPTDPQDGATKKYVDDAVADFSTDGDWHVGTEADAANLVMENDGGKITTRKNTGNSLRLEADHINGGQIVMHSPVSMPGKVGKVDVPENTSGNGNSITIQNQNCKEDSVVIITPTDEPPLKFKVTAYDGEFYVNSYQVLSPYRSEVIDSGANAWSFNYLIINP